MRLNMGDWILTSSIFIMLVLLIRLVFRKRLAAKVRYGMWLLVLMRLLLPFALFDSNLSLLNLIPPQESQTETRSEPQAGLGITPSQPQTVPEQPPAAVPGIGEQTAQISQTYDLVRSDDLTPKTLLFILWAIGMAVIFLIIAGSNLYFFCKVRKSRRQVENLWDDLPLPVYLSMEVPMPCMFGFLRPAIYVRNQDMDNEESLSYILKHEYMHYRHKDHLWSFLRGLCLILHWYNPLVWAVAYCSKQDAELACDESVIRRFSPKEAEAYGKVLLGLTLQNTVHWSVLSCATTFGGGKSYLKERVSRIVRRPRLFVFSTAAVFALCIIAILFTFTGNSGKTAEEGDPDAGPDTQREPEASAATSLPQEAADGTDSEDGDPELGEEIFVNDFLVDLNGDGITDIIRLSSIGGMSLDLSLEESEALRKAVVENYAGYYQIAIYDGAYAADMQAFRKGDALSESAKVDVFESAQAHVGNGQHSYYEESGRGFLICNSPYLGQGMGGYSYEVFTYSDIWEKEVVAENNLSFSIIPYSPVISWESPQAYMAEAFPIEDMIAYTMELKGWLDKASIIMDTSVFGQVLFTTHYEDDVLKPDAFSIWPLDEWEELPTFIHPEEISSEEALREALTDIYEAVLYGQSGFLVDIDGEAGLALQNELGWEITYQWDEPYTLGVAAYGDYEGIRPPDDFLERMPENALRLPYNIVVFVMQHMEDSVKGTLQGQQSESLWVDWKITQLAYYGTYRMGGHTLDVYRYDYYCKSDRDIDINSLDASFGAGSIADMGDGWYQFDYGRCVIYDRENGSCFIGGSNDSGPGQGTFTGDLLLDYARKLGLWEN